jgi:DNA-binding MarR family transcriptional regulator
MARTAASSTQFTDPKAEFPFDVATYLFHLFVVIARYRDASLDAALKPLGLNVSRHRSLGVIARMQPVGMSELADFSAVDRTTMTRTVDQLVAAGLVDRNSSTRDRRQVILTLTPQGRRTHRRSLEVIFEHNKASLAGVPDEMRRKAVRVHESILANLVPDPALAERLLFRPRD